MCCKLPKEFPCALGIDGIFTDPICSPGTANGKVRNIVLVYCLPLDPKERKPGEW
jgi:hypothetical protein